MVWVCDRVDVFKESRFALLLLWSGILSNDPLLVAGLLALIPRVRCCFQPVIRETRNPFHLNVSFLLNRFIPNYTDFYLRCSPTMPFSEGGVGAGLFARAPSCVSQTPSGVGRCYIGLGGYLTQRAVKSIDALLLL